MAGERHGVTAAVPMENVKDFDILAIDRDTYEQFSIQVMTTSLKHKKWVLTKKSEDLVGNNIIYFFVTLNELDPPEYHIVPSRILAETIKQSDQEWFDTLGEKGQAHNDTNIRKFTDYKNLY